LNFVSGKYIETNKCSHISPKFNFDEESVYKMNMEDTTISNIVRPKFIVRPPQNNYNDLFMRHCEMIIGEVEKGARCGPQSIRMLTGVGLNVVQFLLRSVLVEKNNIFRLERLVELLRRDWHTSQSAAEITNPLDSRMGISRDVLQVHRDYCIRLRVPPHALPTEWDTRLFILRALTVDGAIEGDIAAHLSYDIDMVMTVFKELQINIILINANDCIELSSSQVTIVANADWDLDFCIVMLRNNHFSPIWFKKNRGHIQLYRKDGEKCTQHDMSDKLWNLIEEPMRYLPKTLKPRKPIKTAMINNFCKNDFLILINHPVNSQYFNDTSFTDILMSSDDAQSGHVLLQVVDIVKEEMSETFPLGEKPDCLLLQWQFGQGCSTLESLFEELRKRIKFDKTIERMQELFDMIGAAEKIQYTRENNHLVSEWHIFPKTKYTIGLDYCIEGAAAEFAIKMPGATKQKCIEEVVSSYNVFLQNQAAKEQETHKSICLQLKHGYHNDDVEFPWYEISRKNLGYKDE
jgi:hypothetical protein